MKYGIIADTSCDMTREMERETGITLVPFTIAIDGVPYVDDENLDIDKFIDTMNASPNPIKTSCPSPGDYKEAMEKYKDTDGIFVITISSKLSASYESAVLAKNMYIEEHGPMNIHILDSLSAVSGETRMFLKLRDLMDEGFSFDEIVEKIEAYRDANHTLFVLEDLSNLVKNGRIKKSAGLIANTLNIKPIMKAPGGEIELLELSRGVTKSLNKMVDAIGKFLPDTKGARIVIGHVRAEEKAETVKKRIEELYDFEEIVIVPTRGLSSGYAADKGIVIAFG